QFDALANDVLRVRVAKYLPSTAGANLSLLVYSASGVVLAGSTGQVVGANIGNNSTGTFDFAVAKSGTIHILLFDRSVNVSVHNYALSVQRVNGPCGGGGTLNCGPAQGGRISTQLGSASYTLSMIAGESVSIRTAVLSGTSFLPALDVFDAAGSALPVTVTISVSSPVITFTLTAR